MRCVILFAADFGIQLVVVHDIIAVQASRLRLEIGRGIDIGDAELMQIGDDGCGVPEREVMVELQPVGCAGYLWRRGSVAHHAAPSAVR